MHAIFCCDLHKMSLFFLSIFYVRIETWVLFKHVSCLGQSSSHASSLRCLGSSPTRRIAGVWPVKTNHRTFHISDLGFLNSKLWSLLWLAFLFITSPLSFVLGEENSTNVNLRLETQTRWLTFKWEVESTSLAGMHASGMSSCNCI